MSSGDNVETVTGVVVGVLGAFITGLTWFAVTFSYRMDKHMVVTEVIRNLKVADVASAAVSAQAADQQEVPISNILLAAPILPGCKIETCKGFARRQAGEG